MTGWTTTLLGACCLGIGFLLGVGTQVKGPFTIRIEHSHTGVITQRVQEALPKPPMVLTPQPQPQGWASDEVIW